ncbi:hypothetical protein WDU94_003485 [Cyamophila willieti]
MKILSKVNENSEDLKHYQAQNQFLEQIKLGNDAVNQESNKTEDEYPKQGAHTPLSAELLSFDMKRELLRKQWEAQEEKLEGKGSVHYSDILYGEARQHGVSYYEFSSDETERAKQIDKLNKLRDETRQAREKAKEMRRMRKKQFKTRLIMTENRKRVSQGLPPLELDLDNLSSSEDEREEEKKEEERRKQELINDMVAKKLEEIRKANKTREWDVGKDGQMSQEEWIEKQREERKQEFAPTTSVEKKKEERGEGKQKRKNSRFDDKDSENGRKGTKESDDKEGKGTNKEVLSDEQLLKKMEREEAFTKNSIFCFKSKWAERNKEVFKKYQKSDTSSNEDSIYSKRSRFEPMKQPLNIVDTRFIGNKEKKIEIQGVMTTEKETKFQKKSGGVEIQNVSEQKNFEYKTQVQNVTENENFEDNGKEHNVQAEKAKKLVTKSEITDKREVEIENVSQKKEGEAKSNQEVNEVDNVDLEESLREMETLMKQSKEKNKDIKTEDSEVMPTDSKSSSKNLISNKTITKTSTFGGLIIPQRFMKLNKTVQKKSGEGASENKVQNKSELHNAETNNVHRENNYEQIGPPIPVDLLVNETKSSHLTIEMDKSNDKDIKKGVSKENDLNIIASSSIENTSRSEIISENALNSAQEIEASNKIDDQSNEIKPDNNIEFSSKGDPNSDPSSNTIEVPTSEGADNKTTITTSSNTKSVTGAVENSSSTNFNFFNAKHKATNLKRKLDKPNVEFSTSGKIVTKAKPPSCVNPFRSLPSGVEDRLEDTRSDSRSSAKGVEIAPPLTSDYFGTSGMGGKRKGGRGGGGNKMMESVSVGMKQVKDKKNENRGKRVKGLLDII